MHILSSQYLETAAINGSKKETHAEWLILSTAYWNPKTVPGKMPFFYIEAYNMANQEILRTQILRFRITLQYTKMEEFLVLASAIHLVKWAPVHKAYDTFLRAEFKGTLV